MARVKLTIQYDGGMYHGFQIQPNAVTVEETLEKALSELYGRPINIVGSGRTDAGVHAIAQTAHFDAPDDFNLPVEKLPYAVAPYLPRDIAVLSAEEADANFHARYSAKSKTYIYRAVISDVNLPLENGRAWIIPPPLNIEDIKNGAEYFKGRHDFKGFMSSGSGVDGTIRTIYDISLNAKGNVLEFTVSADGFLYNMVRIIVGTLIAVGRGKIDLRQLPEIIESGERGRAGVTAPSCGLYLVKADYGSDNN